MGTERGLSRKSDITLVLGGARSGKSVFAEKLALMSGMPVTYLAAADARDPEMEDRIAMHRSRRPSVWTTFEGDPYEIRDAVCKISGVLLLDCLTLWLTRLFLEKGDVESASEKEWRAREAHIRALTEALCTLPVEGTRLIIVSNEVGLGLVPSYKMGRRFRDLQGRMNQLCASKADRVVLLVAGCPLWIKGSSDWLE